MTDQINVTAVGHHVVITVDGTSATLTPREAQLFAFRLARAYARAGNPASVRGSLVLLRPDEQEDRC